jgi:hypothetical protein
MLFFSCTCTDNNFSIVIINIFQTELRTSDYSQVITRTTDWRALQGSAFYDTWKQTRARETSERHKFILANAVIYFGYRALRIRELRYRPCYPKIPSGPNRCYPQIHSGSDLCYHPVLSVVLFITSRHVGVLPTLYHLFSVYRHNHLTALRNITKQVIFTVRLVFGLKNCVPVWHSDGMFRPKYSDHHQGTFMLEGSVVTVVLSK